MNWYIYSVSVMIRLVRSTMMSLLRFTILVILGVVTSQNHDANSQIPYGGRPRQRSVEATTLIPPDPHIENEGVQMLLTRLESLCIEKLEYLISDTNDRFQSLENKLSQGSSCPHIENLETKVEDLGKQFNTETQKTIDKIQENMRDELGQNNKNLETKVEDLGKQFNTETQKTIAKIQEVSSEVNSTVDNLRDELGQNNKNLETKVEDLGKQFNTETQKTIDKIQEVSSEVHSTVDNMRDELGQNNKNLETKVEDLGKQFNTETQKTIAKIQEVSSEVNSTVDNMRDELGQNNKNLETKVEDLGIQFLENIQNLTDASRNLPSDVEAIKQNVSSLINVTRSLVNISSNSELKLIFYEELQKIKDLQTTTVTSCPLNSTLDKQYPKNCREVLKSGKTASGTYMIQPERAPKPFEVVCDMETRGGGWTVIQRRFDGSQDFYLGWEDYKIGFGNLGGEFWLGLENIHLLTGFEVNELLIELGDFESQNKSAFYSEFRVGSEIEGYSLKVLGAYSGDAGNALMLQAAMKFTTKDKDQDAASSTQCAHNHGGAWWYNHCAQSNLNGKYFGRGQVPDTKILFHTVFWFHFKNDYSSLKHTRMLVRPKV